MVEGFLAFLLYLATIMLRLRLSKAARPSATVVTSAALVCLVALALCLLFGDAVPFWSFAATYGFLTLCFLMVFGAVYKSISLRILLDLSRRPGHRDGYDAVMARYIVEESYQSRLSVILENGYATVNSGHYALTERGRRLATAVRGVQRVFNIETSG
ncbi:hypothetical protein NPA31_018670 [Aurantimonas sp. MSK8Z-1]|uniref:hypothetical protein n=1 Tax=Mangrovibrevibacter kandeliae TaxID=2968473 RepID=UPI002118F0A4|nr:hypothetical protein [Aurantimonas sp. MSK8Z-1]MCW4116987.1 hypothetical protein [Aurantimonas sp. MSK8Z-1]